MAVVLVDLGFGDSGKGSIVDALTAALPKVPNKDSWVIRYSGGPQCAHAVTTNEYSHRFSQFGSGHFNGAKTFIGGGTVFDPLSLLREAEAIAKSRKTVCEEELRSVGIAPEVLVLTPLHSAVNRAQATTTEKFNTCGHGLGIARQLELSGTFAMRWRDFIQEQRHVTMCDRLRQLRDVLAQYCFERNIHTGELYNLDIGAVASALIDAAARINSNTCIFSAARIVDHTHAIFEPAQGILLDQYYGFAPNHTWTDVTARRAFEMLSSMPNVPVEVEKPETPVRYYGIMRAYAHRHGTGPLPTERKTSAQVDNNNPFNMFQGKFRFGVLDLVLANYAVQVANATAPRTLDGIIVNHLDELSVVGPAQVCEEYYHPTYNRHIRNLRELETIDPVLKDLPFPSLGYSQRMTQHLYEVKPVITNIDKTSRGIGADIVDRVIVNTGCNVVATGEGPGVSTKFARGAGGYKTRIATLIPTTG
jgi:adenylosuccinate synthase